MKKTVKNTSSSHDDSNHRQKYFEDGEEAFIHYNWELALQNFKKAFEANKDELKAFERISEIYAIQGDINALIEHYSDYARYLISRRKFNEAIKILESILKIKPDNYLARLMVAEIHREQNDKERSFELFLNWGRAFKKSEMPEEALLFLQNAYEMAPHDLEIAHEIAEIFFKIRHPEHATKFYRALSVECLKKELVREARTAFKTSMSLGSGKKPKTNIDNIYFIMQKGSFSRESLRGILMLDFDEIKALKRFGKDLEKKKEYEEAAKIYNEALLIDPDDVDLKEKLGETYVKLTNFPSALKYFLMAAEDCFSKGDLQKARFFYDRVLTIEIDNPIAKHKLAEIESVEKGADDNIKL